MFIGSLDIEYPSYYIRLVLNCLSNFYLSRNYTDKCRRLFALCFVPPLSTAMKIYWIIPCIAMAVAAHAGKLTPLKNYDSRGTLIYYRERAITLQAARFDLPAPGALHTIEVTLGGGKGTARLRIFGGEGGLNAPMVEHDLIEPIMLTKTKAGNETIAVTLPKSLHLDAPQLFIAVDELSNDVRLLSDRRTRKPACVSQDERYYYQIIKQGNSWHWGNYGYAVELGFEFDRSVQPTFSNVTADVKLPDSALSNGSIAWADINGDKYLDLLAGGKLFRNDGGSEFADITTAAGITGNPVMQAFIDANNDGSPDIVTFGENDSCELFLNTGGSTFARKDLLLPGIGHPNCFSIADIDRDGRLDLFIGSQSDSVRGITANNLYLNEGDGRFIRDTTFLHPDISSHSTIASQWVDYDNDGDLDLYTVDANGTGAIWRNVDGKQLVPVKQSLADESDKVPSIGCGWADYNNDGAMDLLEPGPAASRRMAMASAQVASQVRFNSGAPDFELGHRDNALVPEYSEERAGGAAGDIDNDGLLDVILTTSCTCSYVDLYKQEGTSGFKLHTSDAGLWRVAGGPDAVFADYDNDGKIDLAMMRDGKIQLFKNNSPTGKNNFIDVELDDPAGNQAAVGARVTVHSGDARYTQEITSGRGLAMQDPLRLHFGIGGANAVDSVTVRWPNSSATESFTGLAINQRHLLKSGRSAGPVADESIELHASPNPFTDRLTFTYSIPRAMHVRLDLYTSTGELVETIVDDDVTAGEHQVQWSAKDADGKRLSQGTYVYRLTTPAGEATGKAVLRL
jgi:hypothetical protein